MVEMPEGPPPRMAMRVIGGIVGGGGRAGIIRISRVHGGEARGGLLWGWVTWDGGVGVITPEVYLPEGYYPEP